MFFIPSSRVSRLNLASKIYEITTEQLTMSIELKEEKSGKLLIMQVTGKLEKMDYEHFVPEFDRLVQGCYEPARQAESIFVEPNCKHVRKSLEKRKRSLHAIVSIEAVLNGGTFAGCRFVANNDTFERMTGITGKQVQGKMVNEIWPDTEVHWIKAYTQLTESGSPSTFILYHAQIEKLYRCHLFNPGQSRSLFFVIFTDITNQQAEGRFPSS